jgi:DNA-directed RNA polymerase subunit N
MIIPIRCMTCGKQVGGLWDNYNQRVAAGESPAKVLDDLGLERYCCRSLFLTHRDNLKNVARFRV